MKKTHHEAVVVSSLHRNDKGFTLIELSIVLVIIGLIIGGVLVGRDLIKNSEIRAQLTQIEEFKAATNTFRVKYGYLPGDMPPTQASQLGFFTFTGAQAGNGCVASSRAFGNNDGVINANNEIYPFWSHLGDSKLIKGSYAGVAGNLLEADAPLCNSVSAGKEVSIYDVKLYFPSAKILPDIASISVYGVYNYAPNRASPPAFTRTNKNNSLNIEDWGNGNNILSAYQMYQMDSKIDDGFPTSGDVRSASTIDDPPCTTSGVTPIKYDLSPATADQANCYGIAFLF